MGAVDDAERRARAALTRIAEPGDVALAGLVEAHGARAVLEGLRGAETFGCPQAAQWRVRLRGYDPDTDLARADDVGARLVCPGDSEWPESLEDLRPVLALERGSEGRGRRGTETAEVRRGGTPVALWVRGRGRLDQLCRLSVAVVGSRAASAYGLEAAGELAYSVAGRGVTLVSGAAYGIDGAAHRGALAADGPGVAVLACGVDVSYPRGHAALLERIVSDGVLVSEVPPGSAPSRVRFLVRNRLIAALSRGTVVVEAALRSGALNTARWAHQAMRPVMGVPGPVTSATSAGVHQLVRDGVAMLVTDGDEVLETIAPMGEHLLLRRQGETRRRDHLDETTLRVLEAVPTVHAAGVDRIARTAGLPSSDVGSALARLLLDDLVECRGERWRLSPSARAGAGA